MSEIVAIGVLILLVVLRFGIPVLVLASVAYGLDRLANYWEAHEPATVATD